jgi:hypothetical protein
MHKQTHTKIQIQIQIQNVNAKVEYSQIGMMCDRVCLLTTQSDCCLSLRDGLFSNHHHPHKANSIAQLSTKIWPMLPTRFFSWLVDSWYTCALQVFTNNMYHLIIQYNNHLEFGHFVPTTSVNVIVKSVGGGGRISCWVHYTFRCKMMRFLGIM